MKMWGCGREDGLARSKKATEALTPLRTQKTAVIPSPSAPLRASYGEGPGRLGGSAQCRPRSEPPTRPGSPDGACPERSRRARDDRRLFIGDSVPQNLPRGAYERAP